MADAKELNVPILGSTFWPQDWPAHKNQDDGEGRKIIIRHKDFVVQGVEPAPGMFVGRHVPRQHKVVALDGFVDYVLKHVNPKTALISCTPKRVTAYHHEASREESIEYILDSSMEMKAFMQADGLSRLTHKEFIRLLSTYPECIKGGDQILLRAATFKAEQVKAIIEDSDIHNTIVNFSEKTSGDEAARLPKRVTFTLPIFEGAECSVRTFEADLCIRLPKDSDERVGFWFEAPTLAREIKEALKALMLELRQRLGDKGPAEGGYLFIHSA